MTLPPIPEYTVDSPELVTINLPAAAVVSRNTIPAYPTLQLRATPGVPTLNGSLYDNAIEAYLQDGPSELLVTVAGDKWIKALGEKTAEGTAAARMFLEGLSSPTNGSSWMGVLRPTLLGEFDKKTNVTEGEELTGYDWLTCRTTSRSRSRGCPTTTCCCPSRSTCASTTRCHVELDAPPA